MVAYDGFPDHAPDEEDDAEGAAEEVSCVHRVRARREGTIDILMILTSIAITMGYSI